MSDEKTSPGPEWRAALEAAMAAVAKLHATTTGGLSFVNLEAAMTEIGLLRGRGPTILSQRDRAVGLLRKLLDESELDERVPFDEREIRAFLTEVEKEGA